VGTGCLIEAATLPEADIVLNGIVGAAGLEATVAALRAGKRVALANKETLVMAGELVQCAARQGGGRIVPVDSEHSAILQCVTGNPQGLSRIILTASGGPFHAWDAERVRRATVQEALNHPTWRMGRKITVDSATLANKALEVIEAHFLFGLPYDSIEAVVHPQSIIHSFVEFADGSVLAQLGFPTMELPILYALTWPDRVADDGAVRFDPVAAGALTFEPLRQDVFPAFALGVRAGKTGGVAPAAFNASNEVAVQAFLEGRIPFGRIAEVIELVLEAQPAGAADSLEAVRAADAWARTRARKVLEAQ
jgi:1-deoxy-D-xylulose-5-phosphate reductoisomerase